MRTVLAMLTVGLVAVFAPFASAVGQGHTYELPSTGTLRQLARLGSSDGSAIGYSVAVSGDTVVVGAPDGNNGNGAVYVFVKPSSGWSNMTQVAELTASDGVYTDELGYAVSIDGDTIIAGAIRAHASGGEPGTGLAYVFVRPAGGWTDMTETAELWASDGVNDGAFGVSVSISGSTAVVGGSMDGPLKGGAAYVFVKPASGWASGTQTAELTATTAGNYFGQSTSISGNTVVAGAPGEYPLGPPGAAYVFVEPGTGWMNMTQTAELTASDAVEGEAFGYSVAISGGDVAVGAPGYGSFNSLVGAAYLFVKPTDGWVNATQTNEFFGPSQFAQAGTSIAIHGEDIVVGAPGATVNSEQYEGEALALTPLKSGGFGEQILTYRNGTADASFGYTVAIGGDVVVVGDYYEPTRPSAFVFGH